MLELRRPSSCWEFNPWCYCIGNVLLALTEAGASLPSAGKGCGASLLPKPRRRCPARCLAPRSVASQNLPVLD